MKKSSATIFAGIFFVMLVLQGCGLPNQPYVKKDATTPAPLKVVQYETCPLRTYKTGNMVGAIVTSGVLLGAIGAGLGYAIHRSISEEAADPARPDFGKLVTARFVQRAQREIPGFPTMTVAEKTITEPAGDAANCLEIQVEDIRVETDSNALLINTIITMKDRGGAIVWQKGFAYDSFHHQRVIPYELLKAEEYRRLKTEYDFAVERTVDDFIQHFQYSLLAQK